MKESPARFFFASQDGDETTMRYAGLILLAVPAWLLFYWTPVSSNGDIVAQQRLLWSLYFVIAGGEAFRVWLTRKYPSHPSHLAFPFFDSLAICLAIRFTGGIRSEFWMLYAFQLVAGALDPQSRTLIVLSGLALLSYGIAVLPDASGADWVAFFNHLHAPWSVRAGSPFFEAGADAIPKLLTRFFFLFVIGAMAHAIVRKRVKRESELIELRELAAVAEERDRISRELHDELNHSLVGEALRMELCSRLIESDPAESKKLLLEGKAEIRETLDRIRDYVFHLQPVEFENEPFADLARNYASRFQERTGIQTQTEIETMAEPRPLAKLAAIRILQEAMTNAAKYAHPVVIRITVKKDDLGGLLLRVEDDGEGFDPETMKAAGMGMRGMSERAEALGGYCAVVSSPGRGTVVTARLPGK